MGLDPRDQASAVKVSAMKELVDAALKNGTFGKGPNDVWRQPGDAAIESLAIASSRSGEDELSSASTSGIESEAA